MRIIVCGGRDYRDRNALFHALDRMHATRGIRFLFVGDASGADFLACQWAAERQVPFRVYNADWKQHGRAAGPLRNQKMIDEGKPDGVVAFPGGSGTADMIARAKEAGLTVWEPVK